MEGGEGGVRAGAQVLLGEWPGSRGQGGRTVLKCGGSHWHRGQGHQVGFGARHGVSCGWDREVEDGSEATPQPPKVRSSRPSCNR